MRTTLLLSLAALLFAAPAALAQSIDDVSPRCAAPGDFVLVRGTDFPAEPDVRFGGTEAEVVRADGRRILLRVPDGLEPGEVALTVGDASAPFDVLAAGSPVLLHVSATKATPGTPIVLIGARLGGGVADLLDDGEVVATVPLNGGRRLAFFKVPADLDPGTYTVRITNGDGLDTGACSPELEVVEPGEPAITEIRPEKQLPGRGVVCEGTDLGPFGFCFVSWTDGDGGTKTTFGFANGFDRVWTRVPFEAEEGTTLDVTIEFGDGGSTAEAFAYEVGVAPPPMLTALEFDEGPAGDIVGLRGENLLRGFELPTVTFAAGDTEAEAGILSAFSFDGKDELEILVPDVADGTYDVTVSIGGQTSNALSFTVGALPLAVTSMEPDEQGEHGPSSPVLIEGSGFGVFEFGGPFRPTSGNGAGGETDLAVTWDDGGDGEPLRGLVFFHTDRKIVVLPPGDWRDPLPIGEYTVRVVKDPGLETEESVVAGTYTVVEGGDSGGIVVKGGSGAPIGNR